MPDRWDAAEWRDAVASLRALCPISVRVTVRRSAMPSETYGDCTRTKKGFAIRVDKAARMHEALLILTHEWAHARCWDLQTRRDDDHEEHWGLAYSRAYRAVFPENR